MDNPGNRKFGVRHWRAGWIKSEQLLAVGSQANKTSILRTAACGSRSAHWPSPWRLAGDVQMVLACWLWALAVHTLIRKNSSFQKVCRLWRHPRQVLPVLGAAEVNCNIFKQLLGVSYTWSIFLDSLMQFLQGWGFLGIGYHWWGHRPESHIDWECFQRRLRTPMESGGASFVTA